HISSDRAKRNMKCDAACILRPALPLSLASDARQPGLLGTRQAGWTIVVFQLGETGSQHPLAPGKPVVPDAVAVAAPSFLVVTARIGTEQHPVRPQGFVQLRQHPR